MADDSDFIRYLEQHPSYYLIMQTPVYVKIIEMLAKGGKSFTDLTRSLPKVDKQDMELMLNSLTKLELAGSMKTGDHIIYYLEEQGRNLLERYSKAKKFKS